MSQRHGDTREARHRGLERWTEEHFRRLASLYRKSPCLWKRDSPHYLDGERRHRAYGLIHRAMALPGVSLVEIMLKIREARLLYVRELARLLADRYTRPDHSWFYDLHRFLYPYLDHDEATVLRVRTDKFHCIDRGPASERREISEEEDLALEERARKNVGDNYRPARRGLKCRNSNSSPVILLSEVSTRSPASLGRCAKGKSTEATPSCNICQAASASSFFASDCEERFDSCESTTPEEDLKAASKHVAQQMERMDLRAAIKAQTKIQEHSVRPLESGPKLGKVTYADVSWNGAYTVRGIKNSNWSVAVKRSDKDEDGAICSTETKATRCPAEAGSYRLIEVLSRILTNAPPVTAMDGLVEIAVPALIAAATAVGGGGEAVELRFIPPAKCPTLVAFMSLVILGLTASGLSGVLVSRHLLAHRSPHIRPVLDLSEEAATKFGSSIPEISGAIGSDPAGAIRSLPPPAAALNFAFSAR
ncbi:hypothetical protein KM043_008287 [Ampulex compressa]|nr:hypothetical protein KM043_008287 [Ampulex compressa]